MVTFSDPEQEARTSIAEGATKALIKLTIEEIKEFIFKFQNKDLAFIEDTGLIQSIKDQRETPSWKFYEKYIKERELRVKVQLGLSLRKYTKTNDKVNIEKIRKSTIKKYGITGLHIAEFVSNNILSKYITTLIDSTLSEEEITRKVTEVLANIEKSVIFIDNEAKSSDIANKINLRIIANVPNSLILTSVRGAMKNHRKVLTLIQPNIDKTYTLESIQDDPTNPIELVTFINKIEA